MKGFVRKRLRANFGRIAKFIFNQSLVHNHPSTSVAQLGLSQHYRTLVKSGSRPLPTFAEVGFREYSQFEEDGILLYLFSLILPRAKTCLEICAGNGIECNTANLIINHGWWGFLFDGNKANVEAGRSFYQSHKDTFLYPPRFDHAWITAENVNDVIKGSGLSGPIDLLSLDVDGMDYWIWKAIKVVDPAVVVCEIHNPVPPELALTVPYDPKFVCDDEDYRGASLKAMCILAREKGYRLVG